MNSKRRWYELLLAGMALLLLLAPVTLQTGNAYEYVEDSEPYDDNSENYDRSLPTYWEKADSTSYAYDYEDGTGDGYCTAEVTAWSKGHSASAYADGYGTSSGLSMSGLASELSSGFWTASVST